MKLDLEAIALRAHEEWITSTRGADLMRQQPSKSKPARPQSRITEADLQRWRGLRTQGLSDARIAVAVGVAQTTVSKRLGGEGRVPPKLKTDPKSVRSREWWRKRQAAKRAAAARPATIDASTGSEVDPATETTKGGR